MFKILLVCCAFIFLQTHSAQKPMQMTSQMYLAIQSSINGSLAPLLQQIPQLANAVHGAYNKTSLMLAATNGNPNHMQTLIDFGADLNAQDTGGLTALMYAARNPFLEPIQVLVRSGAEIDQVADQGVTALTIANCSYANYPNKSLRYESFRFKQTVDYLHEQFSLQLMTAHSILEIDCKLLPQLASLVIQYQRTAQDTQVIYAQNKIALAISNQLSGKRKKKKQLKNRAPIKKPKTDAESVKSNLL
jgi:hypothetical protein